MWTRDPTGKFILEEKIRTTLLQAPDLLRIALVTVGKYNANDKKLLVDGWTFVRHRMGNSPRETFDSLDELLHTLVVESQQAEAFSFSNCASMATECDQRHVYLSSSPKRPWRPWIR